MQTVILREPGRFEYTDRPEPSEIAPGHALVRVQRVGVCGTDIHAFFGRQPFFEYPRILGHELGVEVVALAPDVSNLHPGDRCAVEPYLNCGSCIACRQGRTNCCANLKVLGVHTDGGMRDYIVVPANKLHVANKLSFEQLALVETLGIGAHAVSRAGLRKDEWVLVIGAGPIGLATMQFAHLAGANVIALDISDERLAFAAQQGTAHYSINAQNDPLPRLLELTNGDLPTAVFDATGNPKSMERAFDYVASTGKLIFVSLVQGEISFNDASFHRRELTLLATRNALASDFTNIIEHIEAGRIDTRPWLTHQASAQEFPEAFQSWLKPDAKLVKGIVSFNQS